MLKNPINRISLILLLKGEIEVLYNAYNILNTHTTLYYDDV